MKKTTFVILFLMVHLIGFSQLDTYDLSSYTQPDFYRKTSFINPSLFFNSSSQGASTNAGDLNQAVNFRYNKTIEKYNQDVQSTFSFYESSLASYYRSSSFLSKSIGQKVSLDWAGKYFLKPGDTFSSIEIIHSLDTEYDHSRYTTNGGMKTKFKSFDFNTANRVIGSIGKGRIEVVNAAWHAIRIIETICKNSSLTKQNITHEQIQGLANKLGEIQNIRITDGRLEQNKEIEELFKYLKSISLIEDGDYHLFTEVVDAFTYELFANRKKGTDFSVGLGYNYDFRSLHRNEINKDPSVPDDYERLNIDSRTGPFLALSLNYYKPLSHRWQFDFENNVSFSKVNVKDYYDNTDVLNTARDSRDKEHYAYLSNVVNFQYLISSRSMLSLEYSSQVSYVKNLLVEMDAVRISHANRFLFSFNYFLSPYHTLFIEYSSGYYNSYKTTIYSQNSSSISISTQYYFH